MNETTMVYSGLEKFYIACAAVGGFFVLARMIMQIVGIGDHGDTHFDHVHGDVDHVEADSSFKILSLQGFSAFFLMFGLVGLALFRQSRVGAGLATTGAILAGLLAVWIMGRIFKFIQRLQSSGTLATDKAIGCQGSVYLTIPAEGIGRVTLKMDNRMIEVDARSRNQIEIKTGESVRVTEISGDTFIVEKI